MAEEERQSVSDGPISARRRKNGSQCPPGRILLCRAEEKLSCPDWKIAATRQFCISLVLRETGEQREKNGKTVVDVEKKKPGFLNSVDVGSSGRMSEAVAGPADCFGDIFFAGFYNDDVQTRICVFCEGFGRFCDLREYIFHEEHSSTSSQV